MNRQTPRRQARAIAISQTLEAGRKSFVMKALMTLGLGLGIADAVWAIHRALVAG